MKIVHLVGGTLAGGAARGALWLHKGLVNLGVDSKLIIQRGTTENEKAVFSNENGMFGTIKARAIAKTDKLPLVLYPKKDRRYFSSGFSGAEIIHPALLTKADIIHLHWINNGFISLRMLSKITKPVIWTIRDAWPFTGGCHVLQNCRQFEYGCGKCPALNSNSKYDLSYWIYRKKLSNLCKDNIHPVAISHWIRDEAKRSLLFKNKDIPVIHNCIDTEGFFPVQDKNAVRQILSLPVDKKIVLYGAGGFNNDTRKGYDSFVEAVKSLNADNLFFLLFGSKDVGELDGLNVKYKTLGFLKDNISLRMAYLSADVFVAPSYEESFGKTLAEAMACGAPVVAFNATGPMDIVDHKKNGYLARPYESSDLAQGIQWVLENDRHHRELSNCAVKKVETSFTKELQASEYLKLYETILN